MCAYAVVSRLRLWFTGVRHINYLKNFLIVESLSEVLPEGAFIIQPEIMPYELPAIRWFTP